MAKFRVALEKQGWAYIEKWHPFWRMWEYVGGTLAYHDTDEAAVEEAKAKFSAKNAYPKYFPFTPEK